MHEQAHYLVVTMHVQRVIVRQAIIVGIGALTAVLSMERVKGCMVGTHTTIHRDVAPQAAERLRLLATEWAAEPGAEVIVRDCGCTAAHIISV